MNRQKLIENFKGKKIFKWFRRNFYETNECNYNQTILDNTKTSDYIIELLQSDKPAMISRFGSTELKVLKTYYDKRKYTKKLRYIIENLSGVFPTDNSHLDKFAQLYFKKIENIDLLGIWFNPFEDTLANKYCPNAKLTILKNLEPYFSDNPWSFYLKGKKVLVVHPFVYSIGPQYKKREKLFEDKRILPKFDLILYEAVQSIGGDSSFESWFDALEYMQSEISKIDFDVAIIGAGAYGLPLASHIKKMGKKAIHLGGSTQMLFGIYGRRWEIIPEFQDFINKNWVRPLEIEKPKYSSKVENACYW